MPDFDVGSFLPEFFDETRQRLQSINQKLVLFESGTLDENGLIQLRRDVHTIKGSAQMLGIQDISESGHLFEDAIDYAQTCDPENRQAVLQFLYDMHDQVQQRLQHVDGKDRLPTSTMIERFKRLKQPLNSSSDDKKSTDEVRPRKRPKKKGSRVPTNLLAAIKGTIENSLQTDSNKENQGKDHQQTDTAGRVEAHGVEPGKTVDFRPDVAALEFDDSAAPSSSGAFLRVDRTRLTRLSNQIIELGSDRYQEAFPEQQLHQIVQNLRKLKTDSDIEAHAQTAWLAEFDGQIRQLQYLSERLHLQQRRSVAMLDDLRDQVFGLMLRPLSSVFSVFPRSVRNIAKRCGKKVQLLVAGDAVEMDQRAAEALAEPLIHLINNAVAHGIESPAKRKQCGKPNEGQITIVASQKGRDVHIEVSDDGGGMDVDQIRTQAVARGMISETEATEMDASEIMELIFHPGFTTQLDVSDIAGRGMGMSVVLDVIHELTGTIHVYSEPGRGTRFSLTIPASVTVQKARAFCITGQHFGMLENLIRQVLPLKSLEIKKGHGPYSHGYIDFEHHRVPIIDFRQALNNELETPVSDDAGVMIVEHLEGFLGIVVDEVEAGKEILVREVDPYLKRYQPVGLMGCTITHDGAVLLLMDPNGLKEIWRTAPDPELSSIVSGKFNQRMMLVDDSSIALKIEKNMFESMGFTVDTAIGGKDALEKIGLNDYALLVTDLGMPDMDGVQLIECIRAQTRYQELPILLLATRETGGEQSRAIAVGANACLLKHRLKDEEEKLVAILSGLLGIDEEGV